MQNDPLQGSTKVAIAFVIVALLGAILLVAYIKSQKAAASPPQKVEAAP